LAGLSSDDLILKPLLDSFILILSDAYMVVGGIPVRNVEGHGIKHIVHQVYLILH
jgi:hypothetical protein